jgi:hypothetical protein
MSTAMSRALAESVAPKRAPRKRAAGPSRPVVSRKEFAVTEDRVLDLPSDEESAAQIAAELAVSAAGRQSVPDAVLEALRQETLRQVQVNTRPAARRSARPAPVAQQAVIAQVPQAPQIEAVGGYTKTHLGTVVLVGNVGASKNILAKRVAGKDLVEFSFAARTFGVAEPTWYRVTLWEGDEATLDLVRQGTYLQVKGQAVQSQSHKTGKVFLDVTAQRLAEGPVKGQQLSVAGSVQPSKGYFARLWDALRGR